jgi:CMP-N,N'-diacetyllegionaminic acid synthase
LKKKVLIIGFGSIGKRHATILKKFKMVSDVYILSRRNSKTFKNINKLSQIKEINPDYIIICSRTSDHFKHLKYIETNFSNKIVLIEKPLFNKFHKFSISKNKVFVGYNLRQHPVVRFIKNFIINKKIFSVNINCNSYLPNWRQNINYKDSYSSLRRLGGGVLLDLSHEIDYLEWIFKKIKKLDLVKIKKLSNLKINVEDHVLIAGKTSLSNFIVDLNYYSLYPRREVVIDGHNFSIKGDLINNFVEIYLNNKNKKIVSFKNDKNYTYIKQHELILTQNYKTLCTFKNANKLMLLLDKFRKFKK